MGVMSCSVPDCENVMCDTYVEQTGYICSGCQERFINWLKDQKPLYLDSEQFITAKLVEFVKLPKPHQSGFELDMGFVVHFFRKQRKT